MKASGRAKYSYDIVRPGMIYGRILRSPHAHARLKSIDAAAAEKAPGVKALLITIKPGDKVMFPGEEIGALAATTEQQAEDALRMIKVEWEVLPALANVEQAMRPEAPQVFTPANTRKGTAQEDGDLAAGFKAAAFTVEGTYSTQVQTHTSLETHGCVCEWNGDNLTAWVSTQAVHGTREGFAQGLKIPQANVRVITEFMGGGFGSKFGPDMQGLLCARLAKAANAPVKLMLDRKEEHLATGNRPSAFAKVKAGVSDRRQAHRIRRDDVGHGRRGSGIGLSAALHLRVSESPPHAHRRLHQLGTAARDARARTSARVLRDRSVDGRARGSGADGSDGVPPEEPAAARAERDVGEIFSDGRRAHQLEEPSRHRRSDARSDQARARLLGKSLGRRGHRRARTLRDLLRRQRRHALRHAGHRHRQPHDHGDGGGRDARSRRAAGDDRARRQQPAVRAGLRRIDDGGGGDAGDARDGRQGARRAVRAHRAAARRGGRRHHDRRRHA